MCRLFRLRTSARVLRLKPAKPAASSVLHTLPLLLDTCHRRPRRPARQVLLSLARLASAVLTWSTWSLPCTLALVDVPDVSHYGWSSGLLVRQSNPHVRPSPLQVHRHGTSLLDLLLAIDHGLWAPHLNTIRQETYRTHSFHHGNVSHHINLFVDHVYHHSSQNETQGYFSTLCLQSPPWWVHCQHTHTNSLSIRKEKQEKSKEFIEMTKSQREAKNGSFQINKAWSPKTWAKARHDQEPQS